MHPFGVRHIHNMQVASPVAAGSGPRFRSALRARPDAPPRVEPGRTGAPGASRAVGRDLEFWVVRPCNISIAYAGPEVKGFLEKSSRFFAGPRRDPARGTSGTRGSACARHARASLASARAPGPGAGRILGRVPPGCAAPRSSPGAPSGSAGRGTRERSAAPGACTSCAGARMHTRWSSPSPARGGARSRQRSARPGCRARTRVACAWTRAGAREPASEPGRTRALEGDRARTAERARRAHYTRDSRPNRRVVTAAGVPARGSVRFPALDRAHLGPRCRCNDRRDRWKNERQSLGQRRRLIRSQLDSERHQQR